MVCHQGQLYAFITAAENLHPDDTDALLARVRAQLAVQVAVLPAAPTFLSSQGAADDRQRQN